MRSILLHLGFLITILQHLDALCPDNSIAQLQAEVGENVSMHCLFKLHNPLKAPKVQWNYIWANNSINLYKNSNWTENDSHYRQGFKARTWVNASGLAHGDATLHLAEVTPADQGNYSCWVGLSFDCVSVEVQLRVIEHPPKDLDCGLAAACFPGLVLSLAAAVILHV